MSRPTSRPQGRWAEVRRLGDPSVGQGWLYVVIDREAQYPGEHVYKVLKNLTNSSRVRRFICEIEITNALARAALSVVRVVDYGTEKVKRPFMVTPYFPLGSLRHSMASGRFASNLPRTLVFVEQLAAILKRVHESSVAHRDLKPENVLIGDDGTPVLCDFGLCLPLWDYGDEARNSDSLEQIGSRHYIAPEALGGFPSVKNPIALDVYSVGKIAYELASGRRLPGIELPEGERALSTIYPGAYEWYVVNRLVRGLVDHDPGRRMDAWQRLPKMVSLAQEVSNGMGRDFDPEQFELRITRALDDNQNARQAQQLRAFYAERDAYCYEFREAIQRGFISDPRIRYFESAGKTDDRIEFARGSMNPSDWVVRLPGYDDRAAEEYRDGSTAPSLTARLRIGLVPADDVIPTLATDVIWRNDGRELKLTFALYLAKYAPIPPGGTVISPEPPPWIVPLEWAQLGDEAYLVQAQLTATQFASRFADLIVQTLESH